MNQYQANKNVPKLEKPVARLEIAAYPEDKAGEIFIDEMPTANEVITGEYHGTRTLKPIDIRAYALKLLELADHVEELNGVDLEPNPLVELARWQDIRHRIWRLSDDPLVHRSELIEMEEYLENTPILGIFQEQVHNIGLSLESASIELERVRDIAMIIDDSAKAGQIDE